MFSPKGLLLGFVALAAMIPCFGYAHYTQSITSSTSSLTIPASSHGIYNTNLAIMVRDGSTVRATSGYSYSVDGNYTISLTFSPAVTSGTVDVFGAFSTNTSASTDFQVVTGPAGNQVSACYYCTSSAPAVRTTGGFTYVGAVTTTVTLDAGTSADVKVYLLDNRTVFGLSISSGSAHCAGSPCRVDYGVSGYPSGSVHLGHVTYNGNGTFGSLTDDRPPAFH
jgi:hypothetical protein